MARAEVRLGIISLIGACLVCDTVGFISGRTDASLALRAPAPAACVRSKSHTLRAFPRAIRAATKMVAEQQPGMETGEKILHNSRDAIHF